MRDFLLIVAAFIAAVVGAAVVAQPLYSALSLAALLEFDKFLKWFALLLAACATIAVLRRRAQLHWRMVGFGAPQQPPLQLLAGGVAIGFVMLASMGGALYLLDIRHVNTHAPLAATFAQLIYSTLPAALAVSLLEETYFRGVQFGMLARSRRTIAAILLPAIFYMSVHFLNPRETAIVANSEWFHGLSLLLAAPAEVCRAGDCAGMATTLLIAGVLLGLVRSLGGHLLLCIGLHTGWIIGIKLTKKLSNFNPDAEWALLASGHDYFTGWLAALWLSVPCVWLIKRLVKKR